MAFDPAVPQSDPLQLRAYGYFLALTRKAEGHFLPQSDAGASLGGNLLYVGDFSAETQALVVAGNVAGCATLATTGDPSIQKQVIRDGVVDFVVTSLDEALRILKNEIRKRNAVAVCVAACSEQIEREMWERGVQPDMVFAGPDGSERRGMTFGAGSRQIQFAEPDRALAFITWQISSTPARWMPKLDAIALECLAPHSWEHRWIRLAPRYCGRNAMSRRMVYCAPGIAREIIDRAKDSVQKGEIGAEVAISLAAGNESNVFWLKSGDAAPSQD